MTMIRRLTADTEREGRSHNSGVVTLMPFPCFQPNQPDLNVLTEVVPSSEFPALESACCAAYIGDLSVNGPLIHQKAPAR